MLAWSAPAPVLAGLKQSLKLDTFGPSHTASHVRAAVHLFASSLVADVSPHRTAGTAVLLTATDESELPDAPEDLVLLQAFMREEFLNEPGMKVVASAARMDDGPRTHSN